MKGQTIRCKFPIATKREHAVTVKPESRPTRAARQLALAHHIERLIEAEELADYAEAARALGLTRARLTQVMKLLLLAPELQRRVLLREIDASERALRAAVGEPDWQKQRDLSPPTSTNRPP